MTPMMFRSQDNAKAIAFCGVMCAFALILSYLESFIPISFLTGIPGIKLGFANIAVILVFYVMGPAQAATVSFLRIALSALLFGGVTSFLFSLFGGLFSFAVLVATKPAVGRVISLTGVSMLCAAAHNCGQMLAASLTLGSADVFSYLPVLIMASVPCGVITGGIAVLLYPRISLIYQRKSEISGGAER